MAKKGPGRPGKPSGEAKAVKLDPALAAMARMIAASRGLTTGDYLAPFIAEPIRRDYKLLLDALDEDLKKGGQS